MPRPTFLTVANPFALTAPPDWFLDDLAAYDADLVIFPSQEEAVYRLARRARGRTPTQYQFLAHRPDTAIYVAHRLVPVSSLMPSPFTRWGPTIINDLADRDIQAVGGWHEACRLLESHEDDAEAKLNATIADEADHRARFAWQAIKWRTGQKLDLGARKPEGARSRTPTRRRQFAYRPNAESAGFWRDFTPVRKPAARDSTVVAR